MRQGVFRWMGVVVMAAVLTGSGVFAVMAQAPADALKEVNTLLRTAERNFFSGKFDAVQADLDRIPPLLETAKAGGETPQLKTAVSKYEKIVKDLARRTGKTEATGSSGAVPAVAAQASEADSQSKKMPAATARHFRELNREMEKIRSSLSYEKWWELTPSLRKSKIEAGQTNAEKFKVKLDQLKADLSPELAQAPEVSESENLLTEIQTLLNRRTTETEPAVGVPTAVAEALALEQQILDLHAAYADRFEGVYGSTMVYGSLLEEQLRVGRAAVDQLNALDREVVPVVQPVLREVAEKYGENAMDIDNALFASGLKNDHFFGNRFDDLYRGLNNMAKSRRASAQDLAGRAGEIMAAIQRTAEEIRLQRLSEARDMLLLGQAFDPADPDVNRLLAEVDTLYAAMSKQIEKDVDARKWAGDVDAFAGPGKTKDLAGAALEFIRKEPSWNPEGKGTEILAVAVRGPWDVAARDIFGRIIQWRLPVQVAVTNTGMKKNNVARVYELSVLTQQGGPDRTDKKPPFVDYWVGESWNMRLNKVPGQK